MTVKSQCEEHGCSELLCGCPVSCLESDGAFHEILRAKDKWINNILDSNHSMRGLLKDCRAVLRLEKNATREALIKEVTEILNGEV